MPYKRILVLQLDSIPWSVIGPLMDQGKLPSLKQLFNEGCSGILRSTIPPITPAAWSTFMTGVSPGRHGHLNFKGFDPVSNRYCLADTHHLHDKNIYHLLGEAGVRVGVMMQPGVQPPFEPKGGWLLTGFDSPGTKVSFAQPAALEQEILQLCPAHAENFNLHKVWHTPSGPDADRIFAENLKRAAEQMQRVTQLTLDLYRRHPVDVLIYYLQAPDVVLHKAWRWCLPDYENENPLRRNQVIDFFEEMDRCCAQILAAMPVEERLTLVLSDHGHQLARYSVYPNKLLEEGGFLKYARGLTGHLKDGWRRLKDLSRGIKRKGLGRAIDWNMSQVFMPYQACTGCAYVNLKGRQPYGAVEPEDYARVRDAAIEYLRAVKLPSGAPAFEAVLSGDTYFQDKSVWALPDILLLQGPEVDLKRKAIDGPAIVKRKRETDGIHHPDGLYIWHGTGIKPQQDLHGEILDMAPTLLAALNQPIPSYMEGKVWQDCFEAPLQVRTMNWPWGETLPKKAHGYSAEEEAEVEKRLADLGYLD